MCCLDYDDDDDDNDDHDHGDIDQLTGENKHFTYSVESIF